MWNNLGCMATDVEMQNRMKVRTRLSMPLALGTRVLFIRENTVTTTQYINSDTFDFSFE